MNAEKKFVAFGRNRRAFGRRSQRGVSLTIVTLMAVVMFGMVGLVIDVGRMMILKNELQTFTDAAALSAGRMLDGTQTGLASAHNLALHGPLATTNPNSLAFDTAPISTGQVTDTYATTFTGIYDPYATAAANFANPYRFVQVVARANAPITLLRVIPGIPNSVALSARAIAGQQKRVASYSNGGLEPVTPAAHDKNNKDTFGFTVGTEYTLRWNDPSKGSVCRGDVGFDPNMPSSAHGYLDLGQGNGASDLRLAIEYGGCPSARCGNLGLTVTAGGTHVTQVPGKKEGPVVEAFTNRSLQDPDQRSYTPEDYRASVALGTSNGRRIITAPINDPALTVGNGSGATYTIIGFGNFLLPPASMLSRADICAQYLGPATNYGTTSAATDSTALYYLKLFQ